MDDDEKQFLAFCSASVDLHARSIVSPSMVDLGSVQKEPSECKTDKLEATRTGKVLFCLELQYRNATIYERFQSTWKSIEDLATDFVTCAELIRGAENTSAELVAENQLKAIFVGEDKSLLATQLLKFYSSCFPIRHRVHLAISTLEVSPICSYKTPQFEINSEERYQLVETKQFNWIVKKSGKNGTADSTMLVPSVFFFIHWSENDAEEINHLFNRLRNSAAVFIISLMKNFQRNLATHSDGAEWSTLRSIPDKPSNLTKTVVCRLSRELATYQKQRRNGVGEKSGENSLISVSISKAVEMFLTIPETVPDRSRVRLNSRLRLRDATLKDDRLTSVMWSMRLNIHTAVTVSETIDDNTQNGNRDCEQNESQTDRKIVLKTVIDPASKEELSIDESVRRGIVNFATRSYCDSARNEIITIDEAVMKGLIQFGVSPIQTQLEHNNVAGQVTLVDAKNKVKTGYIVLAAMDRLNGKRLNFLSAVRQKLLNAEEGTFWDSKTNETLSIPEALQKGYLDAYRVEDVETLPMKLRKLVI